MRRRSGRPGAILQRTAPGQARCWVASRRARSLAAVACSRSCSARDRSRTSAPKSTDMDRLHELEPANGVGHARRSTRLTRTPRSPSSSPTAGGTLRASRIPSRNAESIMVRGAVRGTNSGALMVAEPLMRPNRTPECASEDPDDPVDLPPKEVAQVRILPGAPCPVSGHAHRAEPTGSALCAFWACLGVGSPWWGRGRARVGVHRWLR